MWLFVMFDLPVDSKESRRSYTLFRKRLLNQGFTMLQYSVYARYCASEDAASTYRNRIKARLPPDGQVRVMSVTDRQFGKMEVFLGKTRVKSEKKPEQLMLF
ncbi:MAG: CRISPR-associated endonuclease Cas2 [bacterium]